MRVNTELEYVPLSEPRVVRELITRRSSQDQSYSADAYENVLAENGAFPLRDDVICIYADLDRLIEEAGLSPLEGQVVGYLMEGYALSDIADHLGHARQTAGVVLDRAVDKITAANNTLWESVYSDRKYSEFRNTKAKM